MAPLRNMEQIRVMTVWHAKKVKGLREPSLRHRVWSCDMASPDASRAPQGFQQEATLAALINRME